MHPDLEPDALAEAKAFGRRRAIEDLVEAAEDRNARTIGTPARPDDRAYVESYRKTLTDIGSWLTQQKERR